MNIKDKNISYFLDYTNKQASFLDVKILLSKHKNVQITKSMKALGYFYPGHKKEKPVFAVAIKKSLKEWLPVFVQESCHLDQWIENTKIWRESCELDIFDDWVLGKEFDKKTLNKSLRNSINIELDCEKRAVQKIIEWNLPIDVKEYIQRSNAYIMSYNYVKKKRRLYKKEKSPYLNKKIYKQMPDVWLKNYHVMPKSIQKIFDKEYNF